MLRDLETDVKRMLYLSEQISAYKERVLWLTNLEDKRNLDLAQSERINDRVAQLYLELEELKKKYFTQRF